MHQPDDMLQDVELADPTVVAGMTALTLAEEMATLVQAEIEMLEGETRQILTYNHALMETALPSFDVVQTAIALARSWRL